MNSLPDNILVEILQKLSSHRSPAIGYIAALQKHTLTLSQKKRLTHLLAGAIHQVIGAKKKARLHHTLTHVKRLYHQEHQARSKDIQDADLLLQDIENAR